MCAKPASGGDTISFVFKDGKVTDEFLKWAEGVKVWIGHNFLGYDAPNLNRLALRDVVDTNAVVDTLVVGRMVNFERRRPDGKKGKHSLEAYGETYGIEKKGLEVDFSVFSDEIVTRCISDVEINFKVFQEYSRYILSSIWKEPLKLEHKVVGLCNTLSKNGFYFNIQEALKLKSILTTTLSKLDQDLADAWKPKSKLVSEIIPRLTKHGTISRSNLRWAGEDLSCFVAGSPFSRITFVEFNPASTKQRIDRLHDAGWKPVDRTDGYKDFLKSRDRKNKEKSAHFLKYGWKVNETNLNTLPESAPAAARTLADRIIVAARINKLKEWEGLYNEETHSIHGEFTGIGAWPGRMSHAKPNMANVPSTERRPKHQWHYAGEMRALWGARPGSVLVGTDADAIHLRIFAHLTNDQALAKAIHEGKKEDGTSAHWVNAKRLGLTGTTAYNKAKVFIYTWLNGGRPPKIAEILECSLEEAERAVRSFETSTPAIRELLEERIPGDAARGFFIGLDGRPVPYTNEHGMMAGYLQSGEAQIMKIAALNDDFGWINVLERRKIPFKIVDFVHDEWQTDVPGTDKDGRVVGACQVRAIVDTGHYLNLRCPLAGDFKIGMNWKETH